MNGPIVLHIYLAFCCLLLLHCPTPCLAFPRIERREMEHLQAEERQSEGMDKEDPDNSSQTTKQTPQPIVSGEPGLVSEGPTVTLLTKASPINESARPAGVKLTQPSGPAIHTPIESVVPAGGALFGSGQPGGMSPETTLSKAVLAITATEVAPLITDDKGINTDDKGILPIVEVTTEATHDFLKYLDGQLAAESQGEVCLGCSPASPVNTKMLTTNLRTENFKATTEHRATPLPGAEPLAGTGPESLTLDGARQMTTEKTQAASTKHLVVTSEDALSVELGSSRQPGAPEVTDIVSTAVPTTSGLSDGWDDTKLEKISQIRIPDLGDSTETQVKMETSQTGQMTPDSVERTEPVTEATDTALGLPQRDTHTGPAPLTGLGDERSATFTAQSSLTPTSLMEEVKVSVVHLFQSTAGFTEPTTERDAIFSSETTASISGYESESYQPMGSSFKDVITQETTTAIQEVEATLPLVTQEQTSTLEVTRADDETEEGKEPPASMSDAPGATQLSRRSDPLDTVVSITTAPLSFEVIATVEELLDTVTGPSEELFTSIWGSPVTPPGIMEEVASMSMVFPASDTSSEKRTIVPSVSQVNTMATYGLDQLESEEGEEDEDEEEEDEEEEDEEEDEEDKDTDSLDESLDSDTELPGFTLPGITSQEPDLEQENMGPLEGATYQVPDALEWEQQNQGLVRSWMEKLKDKAGYMSGMLVPVGVGIAGALFILGALYSIKVMNRRRRNGFKSHKRKQREFNSMQDRVMLLADSSEDEF